MENMSYDRYPETVGISILIFGRAFAGFTGATRGCFDAFPVGAGEVVQGRFVDCPAGATPLP